MGVDCSEARWWVGLRERRIFLGRMEMVLEDEALEELLSESSAGGGGTRSGEGCSMVTTTGDLT